MESKEDYFKFFTHRLVKIYIISILILNFFNTFDVHQTLSLTGNSNIYILDFLELEWNHCLLWELFPMVIGLVVNTIPVLHYIYKWIIWKLQIAVTSCYYSYAYARL